MKILVTGAAGFIGFHTATRLLAEGHEVIGLDNFNDYYPVELKLRRNAQLQDQEGFSGVTCDLCDYKALSELFQKHRFELACHLAAQVGVRYSLTNPFIYQKSNNEGFLNVLEAGRKTGLKRLVYASSSSVYGGNQRLPFSENDRVDTPISLYAATKKFNELTAHVYSHLYGVQTIGLRLFTVYGPWGRPDMAVWLFTEAMARGQAIKVYNHGQMRRDFTYIDDIVSGIRSALFSEGLAQNEVFNLGNHRPEKVADLIEIIARCLGTEPRMELLPIQPGDLPETYADIEKARRALKFNPTVTLAEGVPKFVEWYRAYRKE